MKRILFSLLPALLMAPVAVGAQDAAVEERLNKLSAQIEDLVVAKDAQNKRIDELARGMRELIDQQNRPNTTYASQEDLKRLAAKLQEIEMNRQRDYETIVEKLKGLGKSIASSTPPKSSASASTPSSTETTPAPKPEKGYEYVIKESDTLTAIAKAYNDQGVKVTYKQIQAANPGLKPENMKVGQKIFIPAPPQ
jgi:LysM repeat protein